MPRTSPRAIWPMEQLEEQSVFISSWDLKKTTTDINKALLLRFKSDIQIMAKNIARHNEKTGDTLQINDPCKVGGYNRTPCGNMEKEA